MLKVFEALLTWQLNSNWTRVNKTPDTLSNILWKIDSLESVSNDPDINKNAPANNKTVELTNNQMIGPNMSTKTQKLTRLAVEEAFMIPVIWST